jgi:hypothetical protein
MLRLSVNDESRKIWKEEVTAYFKLLSRHTPEATGENYENTKIADTQAGFESNTPLI